VASNDFIKTDLTGAFHMERWPVHKLIGLLSKYLEIDLLIIYRIFIGLLIVNTILIINLFKCDDVNKIAAFAFVFLNPYTFRSYYAVPLIISDGAFMIAVLLATCGVVNKSNLLIFAGSITAILFRQTGILLIPIFAVLFYFKYISKLSLFLGSITILIGFIFIKLSTFQLYGQLSSSYYVFATGIISWVFHEPTLSEAIPFFGRYIFFLFTLSGLMVCVNQFTNRKLLFTFSCLFFIMHIQPLAAGPLLTGNNILRLSSLSIPLLIPIIINSKLDKKNSALLVLTCIMVSFNHKTSILYHFDNSKLLFLMFVISSFIIVLYYRYSSTIRNTILN